MITSTMTTRGQTTIPKAVRDALGLRVGDRVSYTIRDGVAELRPMRSVVRLRNFFRHSGPTVPIEEMNRAGAGDIDRTPSAGQ